jgi:hypothetical protein
MTEPFIGKRTIYDEVGESRTPYMTRAWIGRLRLHIFYRGDNDPDPHDHPWDFWTFPLTSYLEDVTTQLRDAVAEGRPEPSPRYQKRLQLVCAWRWHYRHAEYCHRVIGRAVERYKDDYKILPGKIVTIVWIRKRDRRWGFLKQRDGKWCWVHWKEYIYRGGKDAPCQPPKDRSE